MGRSRTTSPAKQLSLRAPKLALIADNTDLVGAGASGTGGIVKGKRSEWDEHTDGIMLMLRAICFKITTNNTEHPAPIRASCPICATSACHRWRARWHCDASA
ncbi:hypothetical protein EI94DRAFT_1739241 [Lactarius quietus]|nr:hypothetical protein EI94DRAFT_1739241 [Lactarius quietus]